MREAVIVSTARTGITKAFRGELNATHGADFGGAVAKAAVERAGIDPELIEDAIFGCGMPESATGGNIARHIGVRAGLPLSMTGGTVSRHCGSGLFAVAAAASQIAQNGAPAMLAGGLESISIVQSHLNMFMYQNDWMVEHKPAMYMPMIETADIVAARYGVSREAQDEYAYQSQMRTAEAQKAGRYADEIIAFTTKMGVQDKETKEITFHEVTFDKDGCNRPSTTLEGLQSLEPVRGADQFVTAGNASQLSDGASASVLMEAKEAEKRGIEPMGAFRGFVTAGCEPDEMGIGPVFAVPKLLERNGLKVEDIGLWELNEAFASQALYCRDRLGIDPEIYNVNGGSISIGHPYGMTGARQVGHVLYEGKRRGIKYAVVTMCIAGGQGAAGLIEIY
ncbi:acetyl-CoA C-acyltransferase [Rhizobium sp. L1K21]|uniref:acetyl-CoA C-acyltransferase n=1 Tax=Rhizobium sp. L1K21 TaxID=2954933 RepID=UPI00209377E5|nr:acetyl-CoA C-acyltransferase [Rhizobium sp. L1K21]MCO6188319.1 acetyl-CoA C-acyltransferase [Rhizobium sp. L1K21]